MFRRAVPILTACLLIIFSGCRTSKKAEKTVVSTNFAGPPTIVYKMKKDYSQLVPVELNADKMVILNYPAVGDVSFNGTYPLPTLLKDGYYLDNRGIGPGVAFTKYSYQEYSRLTATPTAEELYDSIIDKDPVTEMYNCGNRLGYSNAEAELNKIIEKGDLAKKCIKLK